MSPPIHILTIQIDTKSLEIKFASFAGHIKRNFSLTYVRLIDVVRL